MPDSAKPPDRQDNRAIQHYLGHKNIQHTVRYTELFSDRFKEFWYDEPARGRLMTASPILAQK